jgi:formylglycine-generating enzyme required for sulfatase activity
MSIILASGSYCVYRGGSWFSDPRFARVARRSDYPPGIRSNVLGFRLVRRVS